MTVEAAISGEGAGYCLGELPAFNRLTLLTSLPPCSFSPAGVDGLIAAKAADLKKLLVGTMTEERIRLRCGFQGAAGTDGLGGHTGTADRRTGTDASLRLRRPPSLRLRMCLTRKLPGLCLQGGGAGADARAQGAQGDGRFLRWVLLCPSS